MDSDDDTLEGHLVTNNIDENGTLDAYPVRGSIPGNPQRGWSGPYIATLSSADPWGNKYLMNVRMLHVGFFQSTAGTDLFTGNEVLPEIAVVVISAGPNRALETSDAQFGDEFVVLGDDIVFRIK